MEVDEPVNQKPPEEPKKRGRETRREKT